MWAVLLGLVVQARFLGPPAGSIELQGPWRFRTGDSTAFAQPGHDDSAWRTITVPGSWTAQGYAGYTGFAWYRARLVLDSVPRLPLGIRFRSVVAAFEVYLDGQRLGGVGRFPPGYQPRSGVPLTVALPPSAQRVGEHVIALRVYSGERRGGIAGGIRLGPLAELGRETARRDFYLLAIAFLLAGIGLYQLLFWSRRPGALEHLYLFLYCTGLALFCVNWMPSVRLTLAPVVHWYRFNVLFAAASSAAFCFAFRRMFDFEQDRLVRGLGIYFLALAPLGLLFPGWVQLKALGSYLFSPAMLAGTLLVLFVLWQEYRRGVAHARPLLWGMAVLAVALFRDVAGDWGVISVGAGLPWTLRFGLVVWVLSLTIATAGKFTETQLTALYDRLTGLYRREVVLDALTREIRRAARTNQPLAVIIMDLDRFKSVNDSLGHQAGDRVLEEVGRRLAEAGRAVDWLGRYGGEEFLAVLATTDTPGAVHAAERLRHAVSALPITLGRTTRTLTLSAGVAAYDGGEEWPTTEELMGAADAALYRAKKDGRDRVSI